MLNKLVEPYLVSFPDPSGNETSRASLLNGWCLVILSIGLHLSPSPGNIYSLAGQPLATPTTVGVARGWPVTLLETQFSDRSNLS